MNNIPINTLILLIIVGGLIWLQFFLSLRNNRWIGLVIPFFTFILGILFGPLQLLAGTSVIQIIITTFVALIPFFFNFVVYFACRSKLKERYSKNNEMDKMKIRDL